MDKVIKTLLYAGIDKREFDALKEEYTENNRKNLVMYSLVVAALFFVLGMIVIMKSEIFHENMYLYFGTVVLMAAIYAAARLLNKYEKYRNKLVRVLVYFFMAVLYTEGLFVTLKHAELPAVTYIGILLVLPLLFLDRPVNVIIAQIIFTAIFCITIGICKEPAVSETDIWNAITFFFASCAEILIIIPIRIGALEKAKQIEFLSKNDLLTGVLNRNAYEEEIESISRNVDKSLICIYADVNGLHEVNNTFGHQAGDNMLKTVAGNMESTFSGEETYRIGGDEFVVLSVNRSLDNVKSLADELSAKICSENYYVSFGIAPVQEFDDDIHETIKAAEQRMYQAKTEFYDTCGRNMNMRRRDDNN